MNYLWTDEAEQFRHKTLEKDIFDGHLHYRRRHRGNHVRGKILVDCKSDRAAFELRKN